MSFTGAKVNKLNGGLGRSNSTEDNVCAVIIPLDAEILPEGVAFYTPYTLLQPEDAESLGFTASFDANNKQLVYQQISEYFRLAPDATLHLIIADEELTVTQIVALEALKAALRTAKDVKGFVIVSTHTVAEIAEHVDPVQAFIDSFASEHRLFDFAVLTANGAVAPLAIAAYPDLREKNAPNVSVSIAQDTGVTKLDPAYAKYADWGSVLGMIAVRQVNENIGSVNMVNKPDAKKGDPDYPLTDSSHWLEAALSDGTLVNGLSAVNKKALTDKGFIYAGSYEGYGGIFLNSSPTAVEKASDYAFIENNRVWNKAARLIRATLIPEVKGVVKKDPQTGYIRSTTISRWTGLLNSKLESMQAADEISGFEVYVNPKQVLSESSPLVIKAKVVKDDIVHEFSVDLGLANQI